MRIELNDAGIQELLKEVGTNTCGPMAARIAQSCGNGYASDTYDVGSRVVASVYTESKEAMQDNLENNTILRNLGNA